MKKFTAYQLKGEEKDVQNISIIDDNNNVINQQLFQNGNVVSDSHYVYDEKSKLIETTERTSEGGLSKVEYSYNEEGDLIGLKKFFGNELFKEEKIVEEENKTTKSIFQEGELTETVVETENEDGTETTVIYDSEGKILQTLTIAELPGGLVENKYFDADKNLIELIIEKYDDNDEMVEKRAFDEKKNLSKLETFEVTNGLIVKHIVKTILNGEIVEFHTSYEYDDRENEIKKEVCNPNGDVISIHERTYNDQNELIEDIFENLSGNINFGQSYHRIIEIENIDDSH